MTSFQSTLGDDAGIAAELAEGQRAISIAEFFEKNKHMLGFDSGARALVTAVKEAVDNALDAAEEANILPDVYVEITESGDYYRLVVEDNGPGITKEQLPKVFGKLLYGSRFHSREQSLLPDQQVLIRHDGRVQLVDIGTLCDTYIGNDDGEATVPIDGDVEAPCFDRETGTVTWEPVTHTIRHETDAETYRIETSRGRAIEVTGDHSLFTLGSDGTVREVPGRDLSPGDCVVAPERLPAPADVESINLLQYASRTDLEDRRWYVYDVDRSLIEEIEQRGEKIRKPVSPGGRKRTHYRLDGVDVMKDSLEQNYLEDGYLPAEVVVGLGWEDRVADGVIRTYKVGGETTEVPVTIPLTEELLRLLGLYVAEGHSDDRQVGFTLGSHESGLVTEVESSIEQVFGTSTTTIERDRNSSRVKTFGSPVVTFFETVCGEGATKKHVPPFVFRAEPALQQAFLDGLYDGDGSDAHPSNELTLGTTSERLAREVSYLWSMRGVAATWKERTNVSNISGVTTDIYEVLVFGKDVGTSDVYETDANRSSRYRRIPASVFDDIAVDSCSRSRVPATKAGAFLAAGLGSERQYAKRFARRVERLFDGESLPDDHYRRTLEEHGLLTPDGDPTDDLRELWQCAKQTEAFGESDLCLLEVTSVERIDAPEYVYDISVPGSGSDENFVAGNQGALCVKNSRGQQGIGISAAVLHAQQTSGKPAKITSRPKGQDEAQYFELIIDTEDNEPEIKTEETTSWDRPHGTRIELEMEANMRARQQLHDYIEHTAVVNPHARIELREPGLEEPMKFERATDELPEETEEIRPHPHGVELGTLLTMLEATDSHSASGFLQEEFTRVGRKTAEEILDGFRDRHYGRALTWMPPTETENADVTTAVTDATANKGAEPTAAFAETVAGTLQEHDRVAHHDVLAAVDEAADSVEAEYDATFGDTVRENAAAAAWRAITGDAGGDSDEGEADADADEGEADSDEKAAQSDRADHVTRRRADCYRIVDEATSTRKDDDTIEGLATRLAEKLAAETDDRDRVTRDELRRYVDRAAELTEQHDDATIGDTARENVLEAVWEHTETVPDEVPKVRELAGDRDAASDLLEGMRETDVISPPTSCLAPISEELIEAGLRKEYDADFYTAATRDADVYGGDPFIVEAGIAYGGELDDDGTAEIMRFANRVPLVYQRGACATTDQIKSIGWRNYNLDQPGGSGLPSGPAVIVVHVASTNVPFTSESKDAVANVPEIEHEIELAIREAARELKSYLKKRQNIEQRKRKQDALADILPEMARKVAEVTDRDEPDFDDALARIMNNVLIERTVSQNGDGASVELTVENHTGTAESPDITEIVTAEPTSVPEDATVVEMDGEWFLKWSPEVGSDDEETITYETDADASHDLTVDGVETAKLTIDQ